MSKTVDKVAADDGKFKKPAWLKEFSVGLTQGFDSNVYLIDHAASDGVPSDHGTAFTAFNPRVAVSLVPLLNTKSLTALDFYYDATVTQYWDASTENNTRHKFGAALAGSLSDSFSYKVSNEFIYVDGGKRGDRYLFDPGTGANAYAYGLTRERKEQFQDRLNISAKQQLGNFFVRPVASLLYYDLLTKAEAGYANYPDRYDLNGGLDLGYQINQDVAVFVGYRYGHQFQGILPGLTTRQFSSDYQRVLFGVEGKPVKWLTLNLQGGPDFRKYEYDYAGADTPDVTYYFTGSVIADITSKDSLTLAANHFQFVSSTGQTSYFDRVTSLTYKRKLTDALTGSVGGQVWQSDYDQGPRNDLVYGIVAGLSYKFDDHWSASLDYAYRRGDNEVDSIPDREYTEHTVSVSVKWKL
ncbi:MAG: outer membrane beta-barrel protein [Verrucomicrobiales bacterium]|nr:outer membrane beta-barrel protein [Verrucomicrobiales bacterium]